MFPAGRTGITPTLLAAAFTASLQGQQPAIPGPSFEDILDLRDIGAATISPDGRAVAYSVRSANWDDNEYDTEIWLVRLGEDPIQLTRTDQGSSTSPAWSPDGKWIAFIADRGHGRQIHLLNARGGEAWALTEVGEGVTEFAWAPASDRIAFRQTDAETERDEKREETYGAFSVEDGEYRPSHLWLVKVPDSPRSVEAQRLTEGSNFTVTDFSWSPDGGHIAFTHQPDPLINSWMDADISVLDVVTGEIRTLLKKPGAQSNPTWSPDGRWIAYQATPPDLASAYYLNGLFYKIPVEGGTPTPLAQDLDEDPFMTAWTPRGIYLVGWDKTKRRVYHVDPNTGRTSEFTTSPDQIFSVDFTADGSTVALVGRNEQSLDEVFHSPVDPLGPTPLTNMTAQIEGWDLGTSEVISWQSRDGTTIEGVLHKPSDFDATRQYPLFVVIHGGPTGIDYPTAVTGYVYPLHQWLAKGALVLRPNYRGSAGYGEEFRSLNVRNLGVGDAWDVLSGVDHLISLGIVDSSRIAAMGWSQGGYISAYLTTTSDRFAAISVGAGISNWVTYYVNTDIHPFTRQYLKATPWEDMDIYARTSPMTFIKRAVTPTLIQHGEFDRRVPIPNAYELYQGLQDVGVETKLIVYRGFGHGITKPKEQLAATWHNWQWFGKYIWGEQIELPLEFDREEPVDESSGNEIK
jgi:dipeptidyl aminopeptidase/acylaminoacyl peptidase